MQPGVGGRRQVGARLGHRAAFTAVACLVLSILVLLPFAVGGVLSDLLAPPTDRIYQVTPPADAAPTHTRLHIDLVGLDEWQRTVTLRISGNQVCNPDCLASDRFLFVSALYRGDAEGLPPSQPVTFPPSTKELTQEITLPISGEPIRYPFDVYRMGLGLIVQRVFPGCTCRARR